MPFRNMIVMILTGGSGESWYTTPIKCDMCACVHGMMVGVHGMMVGDTSQKDPAPGRVTDTPLPTSRVAIYSKNNQVYSTVRQLQRG